MTKSTESNVTYGSGNVFADLGFADADDRSDVHRAAHHRLDGDEAQRPGVAGDDFEPARVQGVVLRIALEVVAPRRFEHSLEDRCIVDSSSRSGGHARFIYPWRVTERR